MTHTYNVNDDIDEMFDIFKCFYCKEKISLTIKEGNNTICIDNFVQLSEYVDCSFKELKEIELNFIKQNTRPLINYSRNKPIKYCHDKTCKIKPCHKKNFLLLSINDKKVSISLNYEFNKLFMAVDLILSFYKDTLNFNLNNNYTTIYSEELNTFYKVPLETSLEIFKSQNPYKTFEIYNILK